MCPSMRWMLSNLRVTVGRTYSTQLLLDELNDRLERALGKRRVGSYQAGMFTLKCFAESGTVGS